MILHADNFSIYGNNVALMLNGVYAQATLRLWTDPDGVSPGYVVGDGGAGTTYYVRYPLPAIKSTIGVSFRVWLDQLPTFGNGGVVLASFRDYNNSSVVDFSVSTTGQIQVRSWANGPIVAVTPTPVITSNGWYHIEIKAEQGATPGTSSLEIRVEGIPVLKEDAFTLPTTEDFAQVAFGFATQGNNQPWTYWKDYVVWDNTGTYNNDFLGSVLVTNTLPTADVDLNWTPSVGTTGYEILDNSPPVTGQFISAPYDSGATPKFPPAYVAELSDLPEETTSVKAVITYVRAAKSDGGDGSLQVGLVSNSSGSPVGVDGADRPITVAQTYWRDVFEVDPSTGLPWLPGAVNGAYMKINRTS